jgi:hypothetical protein
MMAAILENTRSEKDSDDPTFRKAIFCGRRRATSYSRIVDQQHHHHLHLHLHHLLLLLLQNPAP